MLRSRTEHFPYQVCTVFNLRSIDLNLLPVFEAVYEEKNLSRAAERLGMSQSAVSHALTRLRDLLRDELFVRLPQGVQCTPLADLVYLRVRDALAGVRDLLGETRMFNPATSTRRFYVAIPHPLGPLLAQVIHDQLAAGAPGITVEFSTRSLPVDLTRKLEDGRVDLAIDWIVPEGPAFHFQELFADRMVLVARHSHPAFQATTIENAVEHYKFVAIRKRLQGFARLHLPDSLWQIPANQLLELSEHMEVLLATSRTERIGVVPQSLVNLGKETFGLEQLPVSPNTEEALINLVWHKSRDGDPAHAFVREQLAAAFRLFANDPLVDLHSN
jgi:DNA-binding transcriptional LysR family regulator